MHLHRLLRLSLALCALLLCSSLIADTPPANSEQIVDQNFESPGLDEKWHFNNGEWHVADGVLKIRELAEDNHIASARYRSSTRNAVYQLRFRLSGDVKAFHVGFDPAPGELDKKGHLFSIVITPQSWKLLKHLDKARPQEDPNEVLASESREIVKGEWHTLQIMTWGNFVTARLNDGEPLKGSHRTFGVLKPTVVFRCAGDGAEVDDLKVWKQKES